MKPPICRTCGKSHWSRLCNGDVTDDVTEPVTKPPVTPPVTRPVTPKLVAPSQLLVLEVENEALRSEVARLKQALSEANGSRPLAMTGAERVRKLRAKRKEKV